MTEVRAIKNNQFRDARGAHVKIFGDTSENLRVEGFSPKEVFLTVNHRDVVRGLHFQVDPPQPKLLTCVNGAALVQVVCLDPSMKDFGQVVMRRLLVGDGVSEETIHAPAGHGLGYRALVENTKMLYIAAADFNGAGDVGVAPFDEDLGVEWRLTSTEADECNARLNLSGKDIVSDKRFTEEEVILSDRDRGLQSFREYKKSLGE